MTPKQAVRKKCVECVQSQFDVATCGGDRMLSGGDEKSVCFFYPYRKGSGRPSVKTIRRFCLECMGGYKDLVKACGSVACPVHLFRLGTNPNRRGATRKKAMEHHVEAEF